MVDVPRSKIYTFDHLRYARFENFYFGRDENMYGHILKYLENQLPYEITWLLN